MSDTINVSYQYCCKSDEIDVYFYKNEVNRIMKDAKHLSFFWNTEEYIAALEEMLVVLLERKSYEHMGIISKALHDAQVAQEFIDTRNVFELTKIQDIGSWEDYKKEERLTFLKLEVW